MASPVLQCSRLKTRKQFVAMRDFGDKVVMPCLVLQYAHKSALPCFIDTDPTQCSIGFTVTKKLGNAVRRNRIKRRLKEAVRLTFPHHAQGDYAYVVIGRYKAFDMEFEQMVEQCTKALRKSQKASAS